MDRDALIKSLQRAYPASQECLSAVAQGAEFDGFEGTVAVAELLTIFQRRRDHVDAIGLTTAGSTKHSANRACSERRGKNARGPASRARPCLKQGRSCLPRT